MTQHMTVFCLALTGEKNDSIAIAFSTFVYTAQKALQEYFKSILDNVGTKIQEKRKKENTIS